jgi:excinuclease ABC subunit C
MVGVMTVMESGIPAKHEYRKFKIKQYTKANDPGALREMITRRLTHDEWPTPQLIVVDGNQVQKGVVETVLQEAGRSLPVVGVVKDATHKPKAIIGSQELINKHKDIILMANAEAHRFAIEFHKKRRRKGFIA